MEVAIIGIGAASVSLTEYYSLNVLQKYTDLIVPLKTILTKDPSTLTAIDYDILLNQVASLKELAQKGVTDTNGVESFQSFMNQDMVTHLNDIMRTLSIVSIPPDANAPPLSDPDKIATLRGWQNLPSFQIDVLGPLNKALELQLTASQYTVQVTNPGTGIVSNLTVAASPGRTLQSMLQLEYIGVANAQMAGKLGYLQDALSLSQQILQSLTAVQNISNQIQVSNKLPMFSLPSPTDNLEAYKKAYKQAASAYFSQLFPSAIPVANAAQQLLNTKKKLWDQLVALEKANPTSTRSISGTLANTVFQVIKDISAAFSGIAMTNNPNLQDQLFSAVKKWIMDSQDQRMDNTGGQGTAGQIQDRISTALKTGQNLEEGQREDVRRYLFIFQEFYKSAASMLQLLGEIFDKINQGITKQ